MTYQGVGIGRGMAMGTVLQMPAPLPEPQDAPSTLSVDAEKERAAVALAATAAGIRARGERAGGSAKDVLEAQAFMAEDPTLSDDVKARIDSGKTAERAVFEAFASFRDLLVSMGGYMGERATDLDDVSQRVVAQLQGVEAPGVPDPDHQFVLVARDLAPADTALLNLDKVLGLITSDGGPTSHTAILAREKSIVAAVGVAGALDIANGTTVIVDASTGIITVDPDEDERFAAKMAIQERASLANAPVGPGRLADDTEIPLLANLGSAGGAEEAVELGAEGVGLFRTEFLFLDSAQAPTVEEQQSQYSALFAAFPGKKVVVRALDAGADKPLSFLNDAPEENPALGLRGLRALRANEQILRDQLTAIRNAEAENTADVWVMAPMVSTLEETRYFTSIAREIGLKTAGVMIEVPSSALLADRILVDADFASIGTNDLTQYTLAADRLLGSVASFQDPWHPAVLRLVGEVGKAGAALGKPVGICGEAAADPLLAVVLVGLGATSLSMSPAALADVRAELRLYTIEQAQHFAELALKANSAMEARAAVSASASS
ncbi:phosphoenolpyruvate--protein phosphotransferase [Agreia sp. Leaf210]|uniref:phosphoenolpyruvate--protein phosphotransferase n=1 Tax=Agreia sp. Leaf210 TaxID=1735682 RepID=UPI0006F9AA6A|nr:MULTISPECIES: phosphoenolpyruvate--protein phosphotransferase [Microbacteriaceae]KQM59145.1 phosphoenolpyruvate-protein phosphotransferase [Agreia sp. Leaf210]PPF62026.1 phosphoenolpyruvate--protein phosphotransferase [Clavibacter michiganensis]